VVFIRQRKQAGNDHSADGAAGVPAFRAAESEGMIEKQAENSVFGAMRELANQEMDDLECLMREVNM
jgi:hypothetical protein